MLRILRFFYYKILMPTENPGITCELLRWTVTIHYGEWKLISKQKKTDFLPGLTRQVDYRTGNLIKTF